MVLASYPSDALIFVAGETKTSCHLIKSPGAEEFELRYVCSIKLKHSLYVSAMKDHYSRQSFCV